MVDFRNVISHGYDRLDAVLVVQVASQHIPKLLEAVSALLDLKQDGGEPIRFDGSAIPSRVKARGPSFCNL